MAEPDEWYERLKGATFVEPPMYCRTCGGPLVRGERQRGRTSNGFYVWVPTISCPKNRVWWRRLWDLGIPSHDYYEADVFGDQGFWREPTYI